MTIEMYNKLESPTVIETEVAGIYTATIKGPGYEYKLNKAEFLNLINNISKPVHIAGTGN